MKKYKSVSVVGMLFFFQGLQAAAVGMQYSLIPPILNLDLTHIHVNNNMITVSNGATTPLKLGVSVTHYQVGGEGPYKNDKPLAVPPNYNPDLSSYIHFSPKVLMIPPQGSRAVRLSLRITDTLAPGDYWANVKFSMLSKPFTMGMGSTQKNAVSIGINFLLNQVAVIYGRVGTPDLSTIQIQCTKKNPTVLSLDIQNPSPWKFNPNYSIYQQGQNTALTTTTAVIVLPYSEAQRELDISKVAIPNANYELTWQSADQKDASARISCS